MAQAAARMAHERDAQEEAAMTPGELQWLVWLFGFAVGSLFVFWMTDARREKKDAEIERLRALLENDFPKTLDKQ